MNLDRRLLQQARRAAAALGMTVFAGLAVGVLAVLQARQLSRILARVFLDGHGLAQVQPLLSGLLVILLLRAAAFFVSEVSGAAAARRIKDHFREIFFQRLLDLGPLYTRGRAAGELSALMVEGVEGLDAYFSQFLPQVALAGLVPLVVLLAVFPLDPLTGGILLVTGPLIPFFMFLIGSNAEKLTRRQFAALSRMSAYFLDTLQGLRTLKALNRSREQAGRVASVSQQYRRTTLEVLRVTFLSALALELLGTISTAVIAVQVGLRLLYSQFGFEQAFFLLVIAPDFYLPLRTLGLRFHASMNGVAAARKLFEVLDEPSCIPAAPATLARPGAQIRFERPLPKITFSEVVFTYPGRTEAALKGVTLTLNPGQVTALVGRSGAGKTSLASLLLGFATPQQGQVWVGQTPLGEIPMAVWREQTAWVPQQPFLMGGSLADALRTAREDAALDDLRQAAQWAGLDEWIMSLPGGYDTRLGEEGARLSGGQAQRLAVARAFLRNAPLLVLDEPTAQLDPPEEALLEEATRRLCQERTVLVIAHRLATVYRADQIIYLEDGRVLEAGTHTELLRLNGAYARMVQAYGGEP